MKHNAKIQCVDIIHIKRNVQFTNGGNDDKTQKYTQKNS